MAEKENEKKVNGIYKQKSNLGWVVLWLLAIIAMIVGMRAGNAILFVSGIAGSILLFPFVVRSWLAPKNIFWTLVEEGTVKIVVFGEGFFKALIQWKGRTFDNNKTCNVVEEEKWYKDGDLLDVVEIENEAAGAVRVQTTPPSEPELVLGAEKTRKDKHWLDIGGARYYGFWPFKKIYEYKFRWTSVRENGEFVRHEEVLDKISLKDFIYGAELDAAETKDNIPVDILFVIGLRIVNPQKALFNVQDWLEKVINTIKALLREYISRTDYQEALSSVKNIGEIIEGELEEAEIMERFRDEYGVELIPDEIKIKDFSPPEEYQKGAAKKKAAEWERQRRSGDTMGTLVQMIADAWGLEYEEMQATIQNNPDLAEDFLKTAKDLTERRIALDSGAFVDIRIPGSSGITNELAKLIALWKGIPGVKTGEGGSAPTLEKEEEKTEKQEKAEKTSEPIQSFWKEKKPMEKWHQQKRQRRKK